MAGPLAKERPAEPIGMGPETRPQQPSAFQQPQAGSPSVMFKFGITSGIVDMVSTSAVRADLAGPITLEKAREHEGRLDRWMEGKQGGDLAYEARVTSGNMHVARDRLERADRARQEGRSEEADRLQKEGELHYRMALYQARDLNRASVIAGEDVPDQIKSAALNSWATAGRGGEEWSDSIYLGAAGYMQHREALESDDPRMRQAREAYLDHISEMGERAARREEFDPQFARRLPQLLEPAAAYMTEMYEGSSLATRLASSEGIKSQELRTAMKKLSEDMEKLMKKVADGTADKDEKEKAGEIAAFVKDAEQVMITVDEEGRPVVERILARGAIALSAGNGKEAKVQRTLAKEYATADKEYRKKLDSWSEALGKGKMSAAEVLRQMKEYKENVRLDFEKKPVTEASALAFAGRLESLLRSKGFDKLIEGGKKVFEKETKDIRGLLAKGVELAAKAEKARKAGFEKEALEYEKLSKFYLKTADARLATLEHIQRLKDAKAPQWLIESAKAAYWMLGTENDWRGKLVLKAVGLFLGNKGFFSSKKGGKLLGALGGFLGWLADPKKKADKQEAEEKYAEVEKSARKGAYFAKAPDLDVDSAVKELEKAGAPPALIKAVKGAKSFIGTAQHWRTEFLLRAAKYFLDNKGSFKGKSGEGLLARLTAFAGMIGDADKKMSSEQEKEASGYLEKMDGELEAARAPKPAPAPPRPARAEQKEREPEAAPVRAPAKPAVLAKEPVVAAKPRFSSLIKVRVADKQAEAAALELEKAGAPPDVVKAVRESAAADPRSRAMALDAANFYIANKKTFDMPRMEETKKFFEDMISGLAGGRVDSKDLDKAETVLTQAKEFVGGYEKRFMSYMLEANEKGIDDMELIRSYGKEKVFTDSIALMIGEWKAFGKRIADKEEISKQDYDDHSQKLLIAEQASAFYLGIDDPEMRKAVEPFLGRALNAAREGRFEDAVLQLFFAKQYAGADRDYRKALSAGSADLESKKDPAAARAMLAEKLAGELDQEVAKLADDNPAKASFRDYSAAMRAKGKDISMEELQRVSDARAVVLDIDDSEKLLSRKAHKDAKEGAYRIFARAADAFAGKDPIESVELHLYLGRRFILKKGERADIEKASAGMEAATQRIRKGELDPASDEGQKAVAGIFAYRTLSQKTDILREEQEGLKRGSAQWKLYERMIQELDTYRKKLAAGEEVSADEAKRAEGYFMMFFGGRSEMKSSFGIDAEGISGNLGHVPKGEREKAAQISLYAFEAWEKGDAEGWIIYTRLAASMANPDKKIRQGAAALAADYHEGKTAPTKAEWLSDAYLTKTNIDRNIKDRKQLKKADGYFGQILAAYERGDVNGAKSGFELFALFADNAALGKAADKEAYAYIDGFFGEGGIFAQAKKNNVTFAEAYAVSKGIAYSGDDSASIITGIMYEVKSRRVHISEKLFIKENDESFAADAKRREKQYGRERERLLARAKTARKRGDETEAARLDEEASYVDHAWAAGMAEKSKLLYREGVRLFDEALELRKRAAAEPAKAQEYEAQAQEKERLAQKYISIAGTMLGGLKTFDKSVMTLYTNHRERGRENLHIGIAGIADLAVGSIGTGGFGPDEEKKVQRYASMAGIGNDEVLKQDGIQKEKWRFKVWYDKLEKQSKELEERYKDLKWGAVTADTNGGYNKNVYYSYDEAQELYRNGTLSYGESWFGKVKDSYAVVHDHATVVGEINKGRAYANGENFGQARRTARKTEAKLNWSNAAGDAETQFKNLKTIMFEWGGEEHFDIITYEKDLEVAWKEIERGNYGRANGLVADVSERVTIDGAKQEMDNLAWELDNRASMLDSDRNRWDRFNPFFGAKLDSKAEAKYKEYIEFLKTHKATFVINNKDGTTEYKEYIPFEELKKSYDRTRDNLRSVAKGIREEVPNIKTVEDVRLGRKALFEIQGDKESYEAFTNPWNTKISTDKWVEEGRMTAGGQSYLLAFSGNAAARKVLSYAEQGWMITKDAYSMSVENFMSGHYLLRTGKLEKYGGNLERTSNGWLQLADSFAFKPEMTDSLINSGIIRLPRIEEKTIGDVKISGTEFITDVPTMVGGLATIPFDTYTRMSGETFIGHSGIGLWDEVTKYSRDHGQKAILGSWGYGFNPNAGRVIVPGRMDDTEISLPVYAGKWERMNFSDGEREIIFEARNAFRKINGEFFGDAIKMNDYIISDKSPDYFAAKAKAMHNYSRALDEIVNGYLNKDELDAQKAKDLREAERKSQYYFKKYEETHDYRYYDLQGKWALHKWEVEKRERGVGKAKEWMKLGDKRSEETKDMMKDAASMEHWAGPIKVVAYGVAIVATGGAGAFVIGFKETVGAVKSFKFQAEMAGGYDNLSTKEKVLGWSGIGLAALGAVSPAFTELGIAAHTPRLAAGMNWTLVGGGIAMGVYQLPDLYKAWQKGEMSGLAFAGNFFANMQPSLQIGIFGLQPKPIANKYARFTAAVLFGMPLSEYRPPLLQNESYAVAYSKMPEHNRARFAELETKLGGMTADEAIGVMNYFKDTPIPLEWAEKMVIEYRKSHALPEGVKPDQKGSLDRFQKVPLDAFAHDYENYVPFPEVSGLPKMERPVKGEFIAKPGAPEPARETRKVIAMDEGIVSGEFRVKPAAREPVMEKAVIAEVGWSARHLTVDEFAGLHPLENRGVDGFGQVTMPDGTTKKVYHNQQHTDNVAQMTYDLAMKRPFTDSDAKLFGSREDKAEYLGQVALLHDADPTRQAGKPARVAATLEWMDSKEGQSLMRDKFGWDDTKIGMAKAIIQRTEFPFDNARTGQKTELGFPRGPVATFDKDASLNKGAGDRISKRYESGSPLEHYDKMLTDMDADARAFVIGEAPIMSEYADKSSWYFGKPKDAHDSVIGLGTESGFDMFAGTSGFLGAIGRRDAADPSRDSFGKDIAIAKKFGLDVSYPYMEDIVKLAGPDAAANWKANKDMFARISQEGVDAKAQAAQVKIDEGAHKAIEQRAVRLAAEAETAAFNGDFPLSWTDGMRKYAAADPARFAVAEHLLDAAIRKAGGDPDALRADPAYGDYIFKLMSAEPVEKAFMAQGFAKELPYAIESRNLDAYLDGGRWKGPVADDARLILKASRGQDLDKAETRRMMGIPEDVHGRIRPDMSYSDILAISKGLHPKEKPAPKPEMMPAPDESPFSSREVERRVAIGEGDWMVSGKQTGAVIQSVESFLKSEAIAGNETDVIVVTGDKRKLNQINQLFGLEVGDQALNAYRDIFKTAVKGAAGDEGAAWLIRPSESGDEAIAIIVVPKGKGAQVRADLEKGFQKATEDVYNSTVNKPGHPLYEAGKVLRRPKDAVEALVDISRPVEVRLVDGKPVARYADGSEVRPEGKKGFLSIVVTSTDEQGSASHAPKLRKQLGVGDKAEIDYRTALMKEDEKVSGVALEVKLAVDDPAVLDVIRALLPTTGKGLYEVENNGFGIRGLNTFLGHYGANRVIDTVEGAVGDYAASKGLKIIRVGTLKYVIEGGTTRQAQELGNFIDGRLLAEGMKLKTNLGKIAEVHDEGAPAILNSISNGHLGLDWVPQDYTVANSAISAMAIADNSTLNRILGEGHNLDPIVKMVREHPEIRNVQDLYTAFDDASIAGRDGPAMKKAFTEYVEKHGGEFFARLAELSKKPGEGGGAPPVAAPAVQPFTAKETKDSVAQLGLDTSEGLANFVRKVALGDKDAVAALARMPQEIRKEIEGFTNDSAVVRIAKNDALFKSYFEDVHGLGRQIMSESAGKIGDHVKPGAEGQKLKMAAGAEGSVYGEYVIPQKPAKVIRKEPKVIVEEEVPAIVDSRGEINVRPKPEKEVKPEPKVIVEGEPEQRPAGGLEDLNAPGPPKMTPGKIVKILAAEDHPDAKAALDSFAEMPVSAQLVIYRELLAQAKWNFDGADGLAAAGKPDEAAQARALAESIHRKAVGAGELMALSGDVGRNFEKMHGLRQGELAKAYAGAGSIEEGRKEVAKRLGITTPNYSDDHIFGMLFSGDLVSVIKNLHPDAAAIEVVDIGGGATGAYMVKVTDSAGQVHREFVKKVDMTADAAGAESLRLSGIPAPDVITRHPSGRELMYLRPDGTVSKYGITRSIGEFNGTLRLAGKDIKLTTDNAVSLNDMKDSPWMMDMFLNHPDVFWNELGYMNAAGFAVGAIDGHQGNVFGMVLSIKNPTSENIKALQDSGFHVFQDQKGDYKMFRLGRIDTDDSGGTYWAVGEKGGFSFDSFEKWTGERHVFPRLLLHFTKVMNTHAAEMAGPYVLQIPPAKVGYAQSKLWPVKQAPDGSFVLVTYSPKQAGKFEREGFAIISRPAYEPKFVSVRDVLGQGFGRGNGDFYKGMRRWVGERGSDPAYRKAMEDGFRNREGQSVGVSSFHLDQPRKEQLHQEGVTYQHYPNNGEEITPAFFSDGRTRMMADYEKVAVKPTDNELIANFPHDKPVFVVEVSKKEAKGVAGSFKVGRKWLAVYPDYGSVPAGFRDRAVGAVRHHNVLRASPGFGKATGLKTQKVGAVHVFEYIMDLGKKGFVDEFISIEKIFEKTEKDAEKGFAGGTPWAKDIFLNERLPIGFGPEAFPTIKP